MPKIHRSSNMLLPAVHFLPTSCTGKKTIDHLIFLVLSHFKKCRLITLTEWIWYLNGPSLNLSGKDLCSNPLKVAKSTSTYKLFSLLKHI